MAKDDLAPLRDGKIAFIMGFQLIHSERLLANVSSQWRVPAWRKSAMGLGINKDISAQDGGAAGQAVLHAGLPRHVHRCDTLGRSPSSSKSSAHRRRSDTWLYAIQTGTNMAMVLANTGGGLQTLPNQMVGAKQHSWTERFTLAGQASGVNIPVARIPYGSGAARHRDHRLGLARDLDGGLR